MKKITILVITLFLANSFLFSQITEDPKENQRINSINYDSTSPEEIWEIQKEDYKNELKSLGLSAQEIKVKMKVYVENKEEALKSIIKQRELATLERERAEKRRESAELQREKAEIARGKAEKQRDSAEVLREKSEIQREKAQKLRDAAEILRKQAAVEREKAKSARAKAAKEQGNN